MLISLLLGTKWGRGREEKRGKGEGPSSFEGWSPDRAKSSEVINENQMTSLGEEFVPAGPDACDHINPLHYSCDTRNKKPHAMINDLLNIVFLAAFSLNASFLCVSVIEVIFLTGNFNLKFSSTCCAFRINDYFCLPKSS